jgi:hypothetical protein
MTALYSREMKQLNKMENHAGQCSTEKQFEHQFLGLTNPTHSKIKKQVFH